MPTLDDIPILTSLSPSGDDLLPIYDTAGSGLSQVRKVTVDSLRGIAPSGEITTDADAGSITISTRVLVISGGSTSTITLPAASGALREIFVINDGSGTATLPTLAAGTEAVTTGTSAHLLSNGTGWYRVS
jgi:hypothetical protein